MRKKWKYIKLYIGLLLACFVIPERVFATGESTNEMSGEIEVIMHYSYDDMKDYILAFERKYPNVKVTYTCYPEYEPNLRPRIESGDYGDVIFIPSFFDAVKCETYLEPFGKKEDYDQKYNFLGQGYNHNELIYGIPSYAYLSGFIYNKEVFDKAGVSDIPETIEEFMDAMRLIKEHTDAIPLYTNCVDDWAIQYWEVFPFVDMTGDATYRYHGFIYEENPFRIGTPHYQVYKLLYEMAEERLIEDDPTATNWELSKSMLNEGKIGCVPMGSWAIAQFQNMNRANAKNIGFMPFPNKIDGKQYMTVAVDYSYAITKNSDNKSAARAFIEFMIEESGYALDHQNLSVVKTDPYPDSFQNMDQVVILSNAMASGDSYADYQTLSTNLNLEVADEIQRMVEAGFGIRDEAFDEIIDDWNTRWESSRTQEMRYKTIEIAPDQQTILLMNNAELQLSKAEEDYIKQKKSLKVGYHRYQAPFSYEEQQRFSGLAYELCQMIAVNTGLAMEYYGYDDTVEMIEALNNGDIDVIAALEKTKDFEVVVKYSKNYLEFMNVVVSLDTAHTSDLSDKKAAVVENEANDYWDNVADKMFYPTILDCITSVQNGRADYTITNFYSANYLMKDKEYKNLVMMPSATEGTLHLAFSKTADAALVALCNKCIYGISEGNTQIILQKYMEMKETNITLRRFVETNPILSIMVVIAFFTIVMFAIIFILIEKSKSAKKHAVDVKRYEILSGLSDEYIFDYNCRKEEIYFDPKFAQTFSFGGVVKWHQHTEENTELAQFLEQLKSAKNRDDDIPINFQMNRMNGQKIWYRMLGSTVRDNYGKPIHMIGKLVNIQKEMEEVQNYQSEAETDPLTKLFNRNGFFRRVNPDAQNVMFAVLDIDNFKMVNDSFGHIGGDFILKMLAMKLREEMGEMAIIARYGGDEFIVMLSMVSQTEADFRLKQLVKSMDTEIEYEGKLRKLSISVGAVYIAQMQDIDSVFKKADEVLYNVKEMGKNNYELRVLDDSVI